MLYKPNESISESPSCCPLCVHTAVLQALVGHQYGPAGLPSQVEVTEFQLLLQESQRAGVSTQELERVYRRDENSVPPSYRLRHGQVIALKNLPV